jgi:hypothetical protein
MLSSESSSYSVFLIVPLTVSLGQAVPTAPHVLLVHHRSLQLWQTDAFRTYELAPLGLQREQDIVGTLRLQARV